MNWPLLSEIYNERISIRVQETGDGGICLYPFRLDDGCLVRRSSSLPQNGDQCAGSDLKLTCSHAVHINRQGSMSERGQSVTVFLHL